MSVAIFAMGKKSFFNNRYFWRHTGLVSSRSPDCTRRPRQLKCLSINNFFLLKGTKTFSPVRGCGLAERKKGRVEGGRKRVSGYNFQLHYSNFMQSKCLKTGFTTNPDNRGSSLRHFGEFWVLSLFSILNGLS